MDIVLADEFKHNNNNEIHCVKVSIAQIDIDVSHAESAVTSLSSSTTDLNNDENTAPAKKLK